MQMSDSRDANSSESEPRTLRTVVSTRIRRALEPLGPPRRRALVLAAAAAGVLMAFFLVWLITRPPRIEVLTVRPAAVDIALSVVGRVRPTNLVDVRSPNAGQVVRLYRDDGDAVSAGEPLAVVRATVEQAQTEAALARENAARAEVTRARLAYNRVRTLADKGFASPAALDDARAALRTAEAALAAASADRRAASERTREFTIRAPMAGVVLVRPIDNGQVISPETTLFQLGSADGVEIQAEVDEAYADALQAGMQARAALSGSDAQFAARVTEVSPRIDAATGGRLVKLEPDEDIAVPAGRSVDVTIVIERRPKAIVIPREAVLDAAGEARVYVVDDAGVVRERVLRILDWPSLNAIVEAGLAEGDRVVITPAQTRPDARARVRERTAIAPPPEG